MPTNDDQDIVLFPQPPPGVVVPADSDITKEQYEEFALQCFSNAGLSGPGLMEFARIVSEGHTVRIRQEGGKTVIEVFENP